MYPEGKAVKKPYNGYREVLSALTRMFTRNAQGSAACFSAVRLLHRTLCTNQYVVIKKRAWKVIAKGI